jgi:hypothetical protein
MWSVLSSVSVCLLSDFSQTRPHISEFPFVGTNRVCISVLLDLLYRNATVFRTIEHHWNSCWNAMALRPPKRILSFILSPTHKKKNKKKEIIKDGDYIWVGVCFCSH